MKCQPSTVALALPADVFRSWPDDAQVRSFAAELRAIGDRSWDSERTLSAAIGKPALSAQQIYEHSIYGIAQFHLSQFVWLPFWMLSKSIFDRAQAAGSRPDCDLAKAAAPCSVGRSSLVKQSTKLHNVPNQPWTIITKSGIGWRITPGLMNMFTCVVKVRMMFAVQRGNSWFLSNWSLNRSGAWKRVAVRQCGQRLSFAQICSHFRTCHCQMLHGPKLASYIEEPVG